MAKDFLDLTGDGEVTRADVLKGRGVFKQGGGVDGFKTMPKMAAGGSAKPGLYENIHRKRERIEKGSGERMRKPGDAGAPTAKAFRESAKTAKK